MVLLLHRFPFPKPTRCRLSTKYVGFLEFGQRKDALMLCLYNSSCTFGTFEESPHSTPFHRVSKIQYYFHLLV